MHKYFDSYITLPCKYACFFINQLNIHRNSFYFEAFKLKSVNYEKKTHSKGLQGIVSQGFDSIIKMNGIID